ncbi:MAG: hypothetical protein V4538_15240 [Bacteroidota bacterium]
MKKGQYLSENGDLMNVTIIDEENKQVFATKNGWNASWFLEKEYSTWKVVEKIYIPDIPAQINSQSKTEENAIQEPSTSSVFQYSQEGTGKEGSERGGMEQGIEGDEITEKSEIESEETIKPKKTRKKKE